MDKPLFTRYTAYIAGALKSDFGPSLKQRGRQVADIILPRFLVSLHIGGLAVLTAITLRMTPMSAVALLTRSSLLDVLGQDYMRTAKAKGVSRFKTIFKHAFKRLLRNPLSVISGIVIILTLIIAFVIPGIYPYGYETQIKSAENLGMFEYSAWCPVISAEKSILL
jgi:ABC-type dipeptide/oligopeptide/nickel transport system permease component